MFRDLEWNNKKDLWQSKTEEVIETHESKLIQRVLNESSHPRQIGSSAYQQLIHYHLDAEITGS